VLVLAEAPSPQQWLGAVIVLAGVVIAGRRPRTA
jgi:drug/metabolite transporter (DMT)-like permease